MHYKKKITFGLIVFFLTLLIDQFLKFFVKLNFTLGEELSVFGEWFKLVFVENSGMAFGIELVIPFGKYILTFFRILVVLFLIYLYVKSLKKANLGFIISLSLILGGALGNIIDNLFYGVWFTDSYGQIAQFLPKQQSSYGSFFSGKVVDMFWFPLISSRYPNWLPILGGKEFIFFRPVFNFADTAITLGMFYFILFNKKVLQYLHLNKKK